MRTFPLACCQLSPRCSSYLGHFDVVVVCVVLIRSTVMLRQAIVRTMALKLHEKVQAH